jgi:hypothetical protein
LIIVFAESRYICAFPLLIEEVSIGTNSTLSIDVLFAIAVRLDDYTLSFFVVLESFFATEAFGVI